MGLVIPAPLSASLTKGGGECQVHLQVMAVLLATPSPGRPPNTPALVPDPLAAGTVTAGGCLPSSSNWLGGNGLHT